MHLAPGTPAAGGGEPSAASSGELRATGGACLGLRLRGQVAGPGTGISLPVVHLSEKPAVRLLSGDGGSHDGPDPLVSAWPGEDAGRSWGSRVSPGQGGSGPGSLASAGGSEPGCAEARHPRVLSSLPLERGWPAFLVKRLFSHTDQTDVSRVPGSPGGVT